MNSILKRYRYKYVQLVNKELLLLRTIYHWIAARRLYVYWQQWNATRSYRKWGILQNELPLPELDSYDLHPKVTFLLEISSNNLIEAINTIRSIQNLRISSWEVIVVQVSGSAEILEISAMSQSDHRLKIFHLTKSNHINLYKECSGEFIIHCTAGDIFYETLLDHFYQRINSSPSADVYYYDCEYWDKSSSTIMPFFKPAAFSPELILSVNYLSRGFIRKTQASQLFEKMEHNLSLLNQELDLLLHLSEANGDFQHIPHVLITQTSLLNVLDQQVELVVASYLSPEKTKVIELRRDQQSGKNSFDFLGFEFRWGKDRSGKPHLKRRTSRKKLRKSLKNFTDWCKANRHLRLDVLFKKLNAKLRGYYNYYGVIGNSASLMEFFKQATRILFKWLNRCSQRRSYTWRGFQELIEFFIIERPRVVERPKTIKVASSA